MDIVKRVREKSGNDFMIQYRISCEEGVPGAITIEEAKAIAMLLEEAGIGFIACFSGVEILIMLSLHPVAKQRLGILTMQRK